MSPSRRRRCIDHAVRKFGVLERLAYDGSLFPQWRGALLVLALVERAVRLVRRQDGRIMDQKLLLAELGERIRDVRAAPDGSIQVLIDGPEGRLLRILAPG